MTILTLTPDGFLSMEDQKIEDLKAEIEHNRLHGYESLTNFASLLCCLDSTRSQVRRLFLEIKRRRKKIRDLNWLCVGIGIINFLANRKMPDHPNDLLNSCQSMEELVSRNWDTVEMLLSSEKNNNPTVPQRAMPFACFCPIEKKNGEKIAVVEFGCSRGDIGLVWANINNFLKLSDHYFFPGWSENVPREDLNRCQEIDFYFGIDLDLAAGMDDEWLLALWGFKDKRRENLKRFYEKFQPEQNKKFRLFGADAVDFEAYRKQLEEFVQEADHLVFVTSYMLYQLPTERRRKLVRHIDRISRDFKSRRGSKSQACWLNQGISPESLLSGDIAFDEIYLTQLKIVDCDLLATPLAKLHDDTAHGWVTCDKHEFKLGEIKC